MSESNSKVCPKCGIEKVLTDFSKDSRAKDKHQRECKPCRLEMQREYRRVNADSQVIKDQKAKAAVRANAYYYAHLDEITAKRAAASVTPEYKEKTAAHNKRYYAENKERLKPKYQDYYRRNAARYSDQGKARYVENKEAAVARAIAWAADNPDKVIHAAKLRREADPEKYRTYHRNRRARIRQAGGTLSRDIASRLYAKQDGKCACCGAPLDGKYHLDHIMPLALGGTNTDDNVQLLLPRCNMQKRAMHPDEFMRTRQITT